MCTTKEMTNNSTKVMSINAYFTRGKEKRSRRFNSAFTRSLERIKRAIWTECFLTLSIDPVEVDQLITEIGSFSHQGV
jgi:hypothetical protein